MKSNIYKPVWALGKQRLFIWASEFAQDPDPMLAKGHCTSIFEKNNIKSTLVILLKNQ
jgi:hypothetical protein